MEKFSPDDLFKIRFDLDTFEKDGEKMVSGFISTEKEDAHGETVLQNGLDLAPFKTSGFFNDNHSKSTADIIGFPTKVEFKKDFKGKTGWYAEGKLLSTKKAEDIWETAQALKRSNSGRSLGFSVEGAILKRSADKKKIVKAMVNNVAITPNPANPDARMDTLAKNMLEIFDKAMAPGGGTDSATFTGGDALRTESLEGSPENKKKKKKDEEEDPKTLTFKSIGEVIDALIKEAPNSDINKVLETAKQLWITSI